MRIAIGTRIVHIIQRESVESSEHIFLHLPCYDSSDFLEPFLTLQECIPVGYRPFLLEPPWIELGEVRRQSLLYRGLKLRDGHWDRAEEIWVFPSGLDLLVVEGRAVDHQMTGFMIRIMTDEIRDDAL